MSIALVVFYGLGLPFVTPQNSYDNTNSITPSTTTFTFTETSGSVTLGVAADFFTCNTGTPNQLHCIGVLASDVVAGSYTGTGDMTASRTNTAALGFSQ